MATDITSSGGPGAVNPRRRRKHSLWFWAMDFLILVAVGFALTLWKYTAEHQSPAGFAPAYQAPAIPSNQAQPVAVPTTEETTTTLPPKCSVRSPSTKSSNTKAVVAQWLAAWQYALANHNLVCRDYAVNGMGDADFRMKDDLPWGQKDGPIVITCLGMESQDMPSTIDPATIDPIDHQGDMVVDYTAGGVPYSLSNITLEASSAPSPYWDSYTTPQKEAPGSARLALEGGCK